ncbi:unnamed protein product [Orchesella dallaii]|uniref:Gustatory receptor n=1 Tax=Orchesella dallaii TaxID=48710 RepID=A0ABP1RCQ6_9HEXA
MAENFLYAYHNFAYFLLLSPHRFSRNQKTGRFIIVEWLPQKVFCGVNHIIILFLYTSKLRQVWRMTTLEQHRSIFDSFEVTFSVLYRVFFIQYFWGGKRLLEEILHCLVNDPHLSFSLKSKAFFKSVAFPYTIFGVYATVAVSRLITPASGIMGLSLMTNRSVTSFESWYAALKYEGKRAIFPEEFITVDDIGNNGKCLTWIDMLFLIFILPAFAEKAMTAYFSDLLILMHIFTLRTPVKEFVRTLKQDFLQCQEITALPPEGKVNLWKVKVSWRTKAEVIILRYEALRRLATLLNESIGATLFFYLGETIITYAIHVAADISFTLHYSNTMNAIVIFLFYIMTIAIFCCSSDVCRQMNVFKGWLYDNRKYLNMNMNETMFMLDSLQSQSVAISACGVVTMSYSMIGTILGLLVTFFIISLP